MLASTVQFSSYERHPHPHHTQPRSRHMVRPQGDTTSPPRPAHPPPKRSTPAQTDPPVSSGPNSVSDRANPTNPQPSNPPPPKEAASVLATNRQAGPYKQSMFHP